MFAGPTGVGKTELAKQKRALDKSLKEKEKEFARASKDAKKQRLNASFEKDAKKECLESDGKDMHKGKKVSKNKVEAKLKLKRS